MALQNSGAISLNQIHVEAGGSSGTSVSINDADVRGLIGKSSGATMSFSEWYGASSSQANFAFNVSTNSGLESGTGVALNYIVSNGTPYSEIIIRDSGNIQHAYRRVGVVNNYTYVNKGTWTTSDRENCYMKYSNVSTRGTQINNSDFTTSYIRVYDWSNSGISKGAAYTSSGNGNAYANFDWTIRDGNTNTTATQRVECYAERDN
tara:strand:+ start:660 stop:1277 length:618 start_codon:yes stop_codon:yes gene_type:complete